MSNTKFIAEWNEIFGRKITESDLQKPTEKFVFNVLVNYLEMFGMDIALLINRQQSESSEIRRTFKIKFCTYIDHLYKISDNANAFLYYDLIKPSPKKTTHMLKILLNYFLYFNMLREETLTVAANGIGEFESIMNKKTSSQLEDENNKMNIEKIKKKIHQSDVLQEKILEGIASLTSEEKVHLGKAEQFQETIRNCDDILSQLNYKEEEITSDIVSSQELESLYANKALLEQAICEQEEIEKATLASNQDRSEIINKMQPGVKKIESTMNIYPVDDLISIKQIKQQLQELLQKYSVQKSINEKKNISIETNSEQMQNVEKIMNEKMKTLEGINEEFMNEFSKLKMNIESKTDLNANLRFNLLEYESKIVEQNDNGDLIVALAKQVVDALNKI